jgi:hypothetical protein
MSPTIECGKQPIRGILRAASGVAFASLAPLMGLATSPGRRSRALEAFGGELLQLLSPSTTATVCDLTSTPAVDRYVAWSWVMCRW